MIQVVDDNQNVIPVWTLATHDATVPLDTGQRDDDARTSR